MKIIPRPSKIKLDKGKFTYSASTALINCSDIIKDELNFLDFEKGEPNEIEFLIEECGWDYAIEIGEKIRVAAPSEEGHFHAAMTLKQLIFDGYADGASQLNRCRICDSARYPYRGFMLDVSRHFFGTDALKRIADMLALCKMNVLHLHLSDNQGFRIQSDVFPELNRIGSRRGGTRGDGKPVEGYYTKEEITDFVDYCAKRFIEVIPEIDLPGHTVDFLASYPELGCKNEAVEVSEYFYIDDKILCAGNGHTYDFVFSLLDEIAPLFKSRYFHIGGDEVPKTQWDSCEKCKDKIVSEGLKNSEQLQGYFTNRVIKHLKTLDKVPIVWNEALNSDMLDKSAVVQYWNDGRKSKHIVKALSEGRRIIVSKVFKYYLDYCYGLTSLADCYDFEPSSVAEDEREETNILGVEAPLWTEQISTEKKLFEQAFPRLFAVAESGWSDSCKDYGDFAERLDNLLGIMLAYDLPFTTERDSNPNPVKGALQAIRFFKGFTDMQSVRATIKNTLSARKAKKA